MSGFGPKSTALAGRVADGYVTTRPDPDLIKVFRDNGGEDKPMQAGYKVCWSDDRAIAVRTAHQIWANEALPGELAQVLPSPAHFKQASQLVTEQRVADKFACGKDLEAHVAAFRPFADAGFDDIHISQIGGSRPGTEAEGFFDFYGRSVLPRLRQL
jgi:G6PDH family F420-dependent oxidoreductase